MTKDRIKNETITTIAKENRKKRILAIDNDKDTSSSLKIVLEQSGLFEVDAFTTRPKHYPALNPMGMMLSFLMSRCKR